MKKILTVIGVALALAIIVGFGTIAVLDNARTYEENDTASVVHASTSSEDSPYETAEEKYKKRIGIYHPFLR